MAVRLGALYAPQDILTLRAAALLHDLTKECSTEEHLALCAQYGLSVAEIDRRAHKTLHARTAAAVIAHRYPQFATEAVIGCVRWHTTGRADMTVCEKLIYLADYIDMSRTFEDCVHLRQIFWGAEPERMDEAARLAHLNQTLILSYDMTISALIADGTPVSPDTVAARNALILER